LECSGFQHPQAEQQRQAAAAKVLGHALQFGWAFRLEHGLALPQERLVEAPESCIDRRS